MSFGDEVDALRAANKMRAANADSRVPTIHRRSSPSPAETAFKSEVRALWDEADEYWRANKMVDARTAWWVDHGRHSGEVLTGKAPLPFPKIGTFLPGRTRASRQAAASTPIDQLVVQQPTKHVPGLSINGWFAICAPGELRELLLVDRPPNHELFSGAIADDVRALRPSFERALRWSRYQHPGVAGGQEPKHSQNASWVIEFEGPGEVPDAKLVRSVDGPIEVFTAERDGWKSEGTLRQLVIAALADKMA